MTGAFLDTAAAPTTESARHLAIFMRSLEGGGGAERMMAALARGFSQRGHRVDLVLGTAEGAFLEHVPDAVRVVELGKRSVLRAVPLLMKDLPNALRLAPAFRNVIPHWVLGCIPELARYLERERPDAMLSALNYSNLAALWARRIAGSSTRLVVSERNTVSRRALVRRRNLELPSLAAHFYPWADAIAAVSDGVADDLAAASGIPRGRITTTYNPVVGPEISELSRAAPEHPWFCSDASDVPVILGAGKLKTQKGFDVLIDAFARVRAQRRARLMILGEGELRWALKLRARLRGVQRDVAFPGFVENPFRDMARASVFVLSSRWEGLPGVLIQAMACGCPVVSTDCPSGPEEVLDGGRYGQLVPVDDPAAMAAAILQTLDAPHDSEMLTARAGTYSAERSIDRYLALLIPPG